MRTILIILLILHSIIHLFGFLKAYGITEFKGISQPVSKIYGILWLFGFVFFIGSALLYALDINYWWAIGTIAVILSQLLIILFWKDSKYGTIVNLIFLVSIVVAYSNFRFEKMVLAERSSMMKESQPDQENTDTNSNFSELPAIVQKWLENSGAVDKEAVETVYLEQELQMLMSPEDEDWAQAKAEQYFTIDPPAFNWSVDVKMNAFMEAVGRDRFENGLGEMTIKLFSLVNVAKVKIEKKVNQATLQRYLAEIVWFPSASLSPYISWQPIDEFSAEASMEFNGTKGSGIFYFDEEGTFQKFSAMRFKDVNDEEPTEWVVKSISSEERNGIKIPVELEAVWMLEEGPWTWLKLRVKEIEYDVLRVGGEGE